MTFVPGVQYIPSHFASSLRGRYMSEHTNVCLSLRQLARTSARTMVLELGQVIKARSFLVTSPV